ncbi:MAG TPA: hypothetical protein VL284_17625 [Thermoanaerobaculia bacterium]|nr:hypothetical protein [Thermoanaerobaculia bacterium]
MIPRPSRWSSALAVFFIAAAALAQSADLKISITPPAPAPVAGSNFSYTIRVARDTAGPPDRRSDAGPAAVNPGGSLSVTLTLVNNGGGAASGVLLTDTLPGARP